jgi:hypothetical protein
MIGKPHNDHECLGAVTDEVIEKVSARDPALATLAERFGDTDDLAAWFRALPQRDDEGAPCDGPKVTACRPPQRLRFDAEDPNCFERTARWVGAAELIDPESVYRLATIETSSGLHTYPTRDGEPVILDPRQKRNALRAGLFRARRNGSARPVALTPTQAIDWLAELAMEPAERFPNGPRRVENGHRALRGVLAGQPLRIADVKDVAILLALAEREARLWGSMGVRIVHTVAHAIDRLDRLAADCGRDAQGAPRNAGPFSLRIGNHTISPDIPLLGSLARVGGRIAGNVGLEALKLKLATMGITPPVLNTLERELNHEGLSLGRLATPPPMIGSLSAMTPEALGGRWLASKL